MSFTLFVLRIKKLIVVLGSIELSFAFFRYGVMAGVEHRAVLNAELRTVVDIGANKGQFTLAARYWAPNARVFAFEPLSEAASVFTAIFRSDSSVLLSQVAIGPVVERAVMHLSAHQDSSSMLPIGQLQVDIFPGTQESGLREVNICPLATLIDSEAIASPSMLKIDVQGFEVQVLKGCESLLPNFNFVYCECSFVELYSGQKLAHNVVDWLRLHRFELVGIYNATYDYLGQAIQADFLFKRS